VRVVDGNSRLHSAFDAELLALVLATRMAEPSDIHSDCKSAISAVQNYITTKKGKWAVLKAVKEGHDIHKVAAHAERTKRPADWTEHERGNVAADAIAGGSSTMGTETVDISSDVIVHLTESTHKFVTYHGEQINPDWGAIRQDERIQHYLNTRDETRIDGGRPQRWAGSATRLGGGCLPECGISRRARLLRMVWDKYATGYNRAKWGTPSGYDRQNCPTCGVADSQRHIVLECRHDKVSRQRARGIQELDEAATKYAGTAAGRVLQALREQITEHHQGYTILTGMISADVMAKLPMEDLTQRDYGIVKTTMKKLLLRTEQMYLEWGRQGLAPKVATKRKRKSSQSPITRWFNVTTTRLASDPQHDGEDTDGSDERTTEEQRDNHTIHDKRQWDR
jgi:hypothetical protein